MYSKFLYFYVERILNLNKYYIWVLSIMFIKKSNYILVFSTHYNFLFDVIF